MQVKVHLIDEQRRSYDHMTKINTENVSWLRSSSPGRQKNFVKS